MEEVYLDLLEEEQRLDRRLCVTSAMCARCHSGGLTRPILCQNGECSVRCAPLCTRPHERRGRVCCWWKITPFKPHACTVMTAA